MSLSFQDLLLAPFRPDSTAASRLKAVKELRELWENKAVEDAFIAECAKHHADPSDTNNDMVETAVCDLDRDSITAARRTVKTAIRVLQYEPACTVRAEAIKLLRIFVPFRDEHNSHVGCSQLVQDMHADILRVLILKAQDVNISLRRLSIENLINIDLKQEPIVNIVGWNDVLAIMQINLTGKQTDSLTRGLLKRIFRETGQDYQGNRTREAAFALEKLNLKTNRELFDDALRDIVLELFSNES